MDGENRSARAEVAVIAAGLFATSLGFPNQIGFFPFGLLLKNELGLSPESVSAFWAVAMLPWYGKPLVGLICDAYPLFGVRRAGYLLAGTALSALLWLAFAVVPRGVLPLLGTMCALVAAMAFVSATVGGMLAETGQRLGATGRLSSLRQALVGLTTLAVGPVGGWLGGRALGWTAAAGAAIFAVALVAAALYLRREPRVARDGGGGGDGAVWRTAGAQVRAIARARPMWLAGGFLLVTYLAPGLQTPLFYYQQDVLGFTPQVMGSLLLPGAAGALVGAAAYAVLCHLLTLRASLVLGVVLNVVATLLYVGYRSPLSAAVINAAAGVLGTLAMLPAYDLAARSAPRGSETLGFAILMSVQTAAMYLSNVVGSALYGRFHFSWKLLVCVNAAWTAAVVLYLPLLPRAITGRREGK